MQLKGLVRFFAILLVIICLYQLSFTYFVRSYEKDVMSKAESWVKRNYPAATEEAKKDLTDIRYKRVLDSTKGNKIGWFGMSTYRDSKD